MAPKKKELEAELRDLTDIVHRLATHAAVLAVAVRDPNTVPLADLDAALAGLEEIARSTAR